MAYDDALAARIRGVLAARDDVVEKRMFGGIAFMVAGHMAVGVANDALMARVGPEAYAPALARPHVRPMDFTGRPMRGYVFVDPAGVRTARQLRDWIDRCVAFVASLPSRS